MHITKLFRTSTIVAALSVLLASCGNHYNANHPNDNQNNTINNQQVATNNNHNNNYQNTYNYLASLNYQPHHSAIITVNNDISTLNMNMWKANHIQYSQLDKFNRTSSPAIAYLEQRNVANDSLRVRQTVKPTGWHQKFNLDHQLILNRGHIIAYSLSKGISMNGNYEPFLQSGDQNNPRNLFTQTAFCNQELQTIYESKVRDALKQGAKVVYRVQPVFQGNDLMAKGVWLQAVGSNGLNFNVYCFNVQPNYQFNYTNGTSVVNINIQVPTPANVLRFNNSNSNYHTKQTYYHHKIY